MNQRSERGSVPEVRHLLLSTQLFFFVVIAVCVLINHSATSETDGISFYVVYHLTIPLMVPGFCVGAYGMWRTSTHFTGTDAPHLTVAGLRVISIGLLLLLVTPFNKGTFLNWTHMTIGVIVALVEFAICALLLVQHRAPGSVVAFLVTLAGGILAAASLPDWHFAYLLQGEIIFDLGFSWCLIEWTYALDARNQRAFAQVC
jgi:hypothetical protein